MDDGDLLGPGPLREEGSPHPYDGHLPRWSAQADSATAFITGNSGFEVGAALIPIVWNRKQRCLQAALVSLTFFALLADFLLLTAVIPILPTILQPRDPMTSKLVDKATAIPTSYIFLLFSSKALLQILSGPAAVALVRRRGPLLSLMVSLMILGTSASIFAGALCWDPDASPRTTVSAYGRFALMIVARAAHGVASAGVMKSGPLLVAHHTSIEERGSLMAIATTGMAIGMVSGPMLGGVMASYARVWGSFVLILVIVVLDAAALIATFACFRGPLVAIRRQVDFHGDSFSGDAETPREAVRAMPGVVARRCAARGIFRSRRSLICAGGIFLASSAVAVLEPLVPMYLDETFKWAAGTPVLQGLVFSIATLSYLIATPLAGCIAASVCVRERKHLMQCVGLITVAIGVSLVALPAHLWEPHATLVPTVAGLFLIGTSMGVVDAPAVSSTSASV